jgi:hypothetical protein
VVGDLIVLNGDLELIPGGRVTGSATVIGGAVLGSPEAIAGTVTEYDQAVRVVERDGRLVLSEPRLSRRPLEVGRAYLTIRAGTNYNRVEGLPVLFGPVFESGDPNSLKVEALATWRTASGLTIDSDRLGYQLLVEQRFGQDRQLSLGGTLRSSVVPITEQGLADLESSLATFLLHKDYRDYYESSGWSAFATASPTSLPLTFRVEYRDDDHRFAPVQSPWTLQHNDEPWRPQPLVAEGDLRTLLGEVVFDARNDERDPTDGWLLRARAIRGLSGALSLPAHEEAGGGAPTWRVPKQAVSPALTTGLLDLRRYARLGPDSDLSLRILLAGSLDGDPLPPQFQQALGGEGTLPGYGLFSQDCGARTRTFALARAEDGAEGERVFDSYGCDRTALLQLEYRGRLGFDVNFGPDEDEDQWEDWEWYPTMDLSPSWAFFLDVGRGWALGHPEPEGDWVSDVGLGFFLGDLGLYLAMPLNGEQRDMNFFVRLQRRF